jgi:alpha-glucosidase
MDPDPGEPVSVDSPQGTTVVTLRVANEPDETIHESPSRSELNTDRDCITYSVSHENEVVVKPSRLGLVFGGEPPLLNNFELSGVAEREVATDWSPAVGEREVVPDRYSELTVDLEESVSPGRRLQLVVRAYDEGVGLRYRLPERDGTRSVTIEAEHTRFRLPENTRGYEQRRSDAEYSRKQTQDISQNSIPPLTVEYPSGRSISITEAARINYPQTVVSSASPENNVLTTVLSGSARVGLPYETPWRAIVVGETPPDLLENSYLVENLCPPNTLDDTSWVTPGKVIRDMTLSTAGVKRCVDVAEENGLDYVLLDGGWYGNVLRDDVDAATAAPWQLKLDEDVSAGRLDLSEAVDYAGEHGIGVWVYVDRRALERQLSEILPVYERLGVAGVKFGFVERESQEWSNWIIDAVEQCADHGLMVNIHDHYRSTGLTRTYPNLLTVEGIRGNEKHPTAGQNTIQPFTRMVDGPADYTFCYRNAENQTTNVHQMALPVIYFSPLQHVYWYEAPEDVGEAPDHERDYFASLPTTWDETIAVDGEPGSFVVVARRSGADWFVGAVTNEQERSVEVPLEFLGEDTYRAEVYSDSGSGGVTDRVQVETHLADGETRMPVDLLSAGGSVIRLSPASRADREQYTVYR